jgi:uncharacterized membrane protein YdcZ (DUF606 family)
MDGPRPEPDLPDPDASEPGEETPPQLRFPVFILALPGTLGIFFVFMSDALANSMGSARQGFVAVTVAALVAVASFGIMAAHAREKEVQIPAVIGVAISILAYGSVILRSI